MIGVEDDLQQELREALKTSHNLGADFLITPLFAPHPPYRRANDVKSSIPLAGSDTILSTKEWATNIVGAISPWAVNQLENTSNVITTGDEKEEEEGGGEKGTEKEDAFLDRCNAEDIVMQEFSWALHIGALSLSPYIRYARLHYVLFPLYCTLYEAQYIFNHCILFSTKPHIVWAGLQAILFPFNQRTTKITNYARLLLACARQVTYQQLWITIPLLLKPNNSHDGVDNAMNGSNMDGWRTWNEIRFLTNHSHRIFVALDLNDLPPLRCISSALHKLPSSSSSSSSDGSLNNPIDFADGLWLNRWRGEPVKAVIVHTRVFVLNQKKFPVLPKPWQHLLSFFLSLSSSSGGNISGIYVMLSGQPELGQSSLAPYLDYLKHFVAAFSSSSVMLSNENEKQLINYRDVLQSPLQPLMDNLEASTYETFERDSPKYAYYQTAISKALVAMERAEREGENASLGVVKRIVLVVGAGRGPLVQCTLDARSASFVPSLEVVFSHIVLVLVRKWEWRYTYTPSRRTPMRSSRFSTALRRRTSGSPESSSLPKT